MRFILFFIFISVSAFSQKTFFVKDKKKHSPIAYASIYNEIGTFKINSESDGSFTIPEDLKTETFIIESIGYEIIQTSLETSVIYMNHKVEVLEEMIIIPRLGTKEIKLGRVNNNDIISGYANSYINTWMIGKKIKSSELSKHPFIKEINILTQCLLKNIKFKIRLYANENELAGNLIYDQEIIASCELNKKPVEKKAYSIAKIDLEEMKIQVPDTGFFVVIEWIINEANKMEINGEKNKFLSYPAILCEDNPKTEGVYLYHFLEGKWVKNDKDVNEDLLFEVILTN